MVVVTTPSKYLHILIVLLLVALPIIADTGTDSTGTIHVDFVREVTSTAGDGRLPAPVRPKDARIRLIGPTTIDAVVNDWRGLRFGEVRPGHYLLVASMKPFLTESLSGDVSAGKTWYPTIYFTTPGTRTVWGRVSDLATNKPLRSAVISIDGRPVTTQAGRNGVYRLTNIPSGRRRIIAAADRFLPDSRDVAVAGGDSLRVDFALIDTFRPRQLYCSVLNAVTGEALSSAAVSIPGTSWRASPTGDGPYRLSNVTGLPAEVSAEARGFQTASFPPGRLVAESTKLVIAMAPEGWTGVCGVVLDAKTFEPLVGASVTVSAGDSVVAQCATGRDGLFALSILKPGAYKLVCDYISHNSVRWDVEVQTGKACVLRLGLKQTWL
jgi:hypothetical protein